MIKKDLVITYSYAKADYIKRHLKDFGLGAFAKCVTLESLYADELDDFMLTYIIKQELGDVECSDFIYAYRQDLAIKDEYKDSFLKVKNACEKLKKRFNLKCGFADVSDFNEIYVDEFYVDNICLFKNKFEEDFISKLNAKKLPILPCHNQSPKIYTYNAKITSIHEEVKLALSLARKLYEDGKDFRIITASLNEYARYFELYAEVVGFANYSNAKINFYDENVINQKTQKYYEKYKKYFPNISKDEIKKLIKPSKTNQNKLGLRIEELSESIGVNTLNECVILLGLSEVTSKDNPFLINDKYKYNSYTFSKIVYENLKKNTKELYLLSCDYKNAKKIDKPIIYKNDFKNASKIDIKLTQTMSKVAKAELERVKLNDYKLSASKLNVLKACPKRFLFESILGYKNDELEQSDLEPNEKGTIMHSCFEYIVDKWSEYPNKRNLAKISIDKAFDKFFEEAKKHKRERESNIYTNLYKNKLLKGIDSDDEPSVVAKFLEYYQGLKSDNNFESCVEKKFYLDKDLNPIYVDEKLKDDEIDYYIKGFIDRFDEGDDFINIVDYKSSKKDKEDSKRMEQIQNYEDFQLGLYLLYASKAFRDKKTYKASLLTFNTKNLYTEFASLEYNKEYLDGLENQIKKLDELIQKGEFKAKENESCKYCPIRNICDKGASDE